jgi:hypothetical protein
MKHKYKERSKKLHAIIEENNYMFSIEEVKAMHILVDRSLNDLK